VLGSLINRIIKIKRHPLDQTIFLNTAHYIKKTSVRIVTIFLTH